MKEEGKMIIMNQDIAEDYISLMLKRKIVITKSMWDEVCQIMEDGCREVLNDVCCDISQEINTENKGIYYERN